MVEKIVGHQRGSDRHDLGSGTNTVQLVYVCALLGRGFTWVGERHLF